MAHAPSDTGGLMRIPWKLKSLVFAILDATHAGGLLAWLQKHVTRRSRVAFSTLSPDWLFHESVIELSPGKRLLEFGAGKSLVQNLYLSQVCRSQTVVDIVPLFDRQLANEAAQRISYITGRDLPPITSLADLAALNISYIAPLDVARSALPDNAFDVCVSTNTMEHIPEAQLGAILVELRRILVPGGLVSAIIDYSDHYSHTDPSIGRLNFLRFSDAEFRRFNHRSHFQNRLRHHDYERLFRDAGFVVERDEVLGWAELPDAISCDDPRRRDPTFAATAGRFVARSPGR